MNSVVFLPAFMEVSLACTRFNFARSKQRSNRLPQGNDAFESALPESASQSLANGFTIWIIILGLFRNHPHQPFG